MSGVKTNVHKVMIEQWKMDRFNYDYCIICAEIKNITVKQFTTIMPSERALSLYTGYLDAYPRKYPNDAIHYIVTVTGRELRQIIADGRAAKEKALQYIRPEPDVRKYPECKIQCEWSRRPTGGYSSPGYSCLTMMGVGGYRTGCALHGPIEGRYSTIDGMDCPACSYRPEKNRVFWG